MAIGDVTSPRAAEALAKKLWEIRRTHKIDLLAVNAENAGFIMGPAPETAKLLLDSGADVLTGGNHILQNNRLHALLDSDARILRPVNFPNAAPGVGYTLLSAKGYRVLAVNAMGRALIEPPLDSPFTAIERVLEREEGNYDLAILDFHAEATGEKVALALHFDGRFAAIYGTHTHVPTADEQILPRGTGYITDIGYTGVRDSILGIDPAAVIERYRTHLPIPYRPAEGEIRAEGAIFTLEAGEGRVRAVERVTF